MLFNSYIFIFIFLPITICFYHFTRSRGLFRASISILVISSFIFYGWWNPKCLVLLISLIIFDYFTARGILKTKTKNRKIAKLLFFTGIFVNLGALCYYKYANFFIDNVNYLFKQDIYLQTIILPIGISFFTFQKIAFIVDVYQNKINEFSFVNYALFVTFFPQLIAGPIVHHSEVMPQFKNTKIVSRQNIQAGITIFVIGLFKKVVLADTAAKFATPYFNAASAGQHLDFITAWTAALSYTVQLYFDFSAYSDMAIGIGQLFGIDLPVNFNSPYKSKSIIEFWRRWHITLSRFLKDYLYIPLGGNRKGRAHRYINLFITMILGGIWHGAGWTFLLWGTLHGIYLIINHAWRNLIERFNVTFNQTELITRIISQSLTFTAVVVGWVFFRSADVTTAFDILKSMAGQYNFSLSTPLINFSKYSNNLTATLTTLIMLLVCLFAPNTQELTCYAGTEKIHSVKQPRRIVPKLLWRPSMGWAFYTAFVFTISLMMFSQISEFIYFQF